MPGAFALNLAKITDSYLCLDRRHRDGRLIRGNFPSPLRARVLNPAIYRLSHSQPGFLGSRGDSSTRRRDSRPGSNDEESQPDGLATGPLESVFESSLGLPSLYLLGLGGLGILLGGWFRSPRLIQAVAREYAALGPKRSIAAFIPAFLVAQAAIVLGYPISFNQVMISSIVGAGLVGGSSNSDGVSTTKTGYTVGVWIASMVGGGAISFGLYHALAALPGLG